LTKEARRLAGSYRLRLTLGFLLVVATMAGAWTWSLYGPLARTVIEQQKDHLVVVARAGALALGESEAAEDRILSRLVDRTDLRMTLVAADGTVLVDTHWDPSAMENHGERPEIVEALSGRVGDDRRVSDTQDIEQIYVAVPVDLGGEGAALRVSQSLEKIGALVARSRRAGLGLLALSLLIAGALATRLAVVAARPVERLSRAAQAMASGDLRTSIPSEAGELAAMSEALTDLREQMRKRLEDLSAERHDLRAVLDGLTDAVFLLHDETIVFANSAASRLFRPPALGWQDRSLAETDLPASVRSTVVSRIGSQEPSVEESGPDPSGRTLRASVLPLNPTDRSSRTLVVVSDTTERTRLDRVRRDFVANASHELKTPASSIHLLAESAARAAEDGDTEKSLEFARLIEQESARLGRLVQDLLDLSRLEATPAPGTLADVREAIANALTGHRAAAAERGLDLVTDESDVADVDVFVVADPTDIAIALDNLLDNAITYTESGSVTVRTQADQDTVSISVTDTGIGIPAADVPRIFERFYRVDRARSRRSGGTGLGLSLVRHVVERSNGSVEVSSEPGKGSTFTLTLPRA